MTNNIILYSMTMILTQTVKDLLEYAADQSTLGSFSCSSSDCSKRILRPVICGTRFPTVPQPVLAGLSTQLGLTFYFSEHFCLRFWSTLQLQHVAIISTSHGWWLKLKGFTLIIYQHTRLRWAATFQKAEFKGIFKLCYFLSFNL